MAAAYSPLLTFTIILLALTVLCACVMMRYVTADESSVQPVGERNSASKIADMLLLMLGWLPLLAGIAGLPFLECSAIDLQAECSSSEIANSGLTVSLILGLASFGLWAGFLLDRVYLTPSQKIFRNVRAQDRVLLISAIGVGVAAFIVMASNQPVN